MKEVSYMVADSRCEEVSYMVVDSRCEEGELYGSRQ